MRTIFTTIAEFNKYVEGFTIDTTLQQLQPSLAVAQHSILTIIPAGVLTAILNFTESSSESEKEAKETLLTAVANAAARNYAIFMAIKKNGSDASLYKYQFEEQKAHYEQSYAAAMDILLDWLDVNKSVGGWQESDNYKQRQALPIRNAREFNTLYGIDNSSLFFSKIIFLIRNIWEYKVKALLAGSDDAKALDLAKHITAYRVMASAVMQFDVTELPRSIRWDNSHEYSKDSAVQNRERLNATLLAQAENWEAALQTLISAQKGGASISSDAGRESDKFVML